MGSREEAEDHMRQAEHKAWERGYVAGMDDYKRGRHQWPWMLMWFVAGLLFWKLIA